MTHALAFVVLMLAALPAWAGQNILTWRDNSSNEAKFEIMRKSVACATPGTWYLRAGVLAGVTTFTDTATLAGRAYCYKIRARNAAAVSDYSNEAEGVAKPVCTLVRTTEPDGTLVITNVCK